MKKFLAISLAVAATTTSFAQAAGGDVLGNTSNVQFSTFINANEITAFQQRLARWRPERPRIMVTKREWDALPARVAADATLTNYMNRLEQRSDLFMTLPLPNPEDYLREPGTIRGAVDKALDGIPTLAITGKVRNRTDHTQKAIEYLINLCQYADWNPANGIDHAWATMAAGLGYDWLHDSMTPNQRSFVREAIVTKGLNILDQRYTAAQDWWLTSGMNMTGMVNAGAIIGALAVGDTDQNLSARVATAGIRSLQNMIGRYGRDGGWIEGAHYSNFATRFYTFAVSGLMTATGSSFKLFDAPGLREAANYRFMMGGLTWRTFNYGACDEYNYGVPYSFFFSRRVGRPGLAVAQREFLKTQRPEAYDILWYDPRGTVSDLEAIQRNRSFRNVAVASMRGGPWMNREAISVGIKGGDNSNHKSHLDLGTFVLDAGNVRWASDLGTEPLAQPNIYPKDGVYYRYNTEGQNTIVFNGQNQDWQAKAPVQTFSSVQARPFAVINLDQANPGLVSTWRRGMTILRNTYAILQDEFNAVNGITADWIMHTQASVAVQGGTATLTRDGKTMTAHIIEPSNATFQVEVAPTLADQSNNSAFNRLTIKLNGTGQLQRVAVAFLPEGSGAPALANLRTLPIANWSSLSQLP
ncbi:MAG TPA: heparinase II/III family protein [Fimbriimonadaceae bacterium]|nr:heparinase II/III family protein [Fimbriimonadaceae bacterium]HRJ32721.1 heparinase II/III family protein [Fimbriimonadaceae bacterium]